MRIRRNKRAESRVVTLESSSRSLRAPVIIVEMRLPPIRKRKSAVLPLLAMALLCLPPRAQALTVNRVNGGTNVIYIDFSIPGKVVPLELVRSYNSITALNESNGWLGAFGWGWTSPFETTLTVTSKKSLRLMEREDMTRCSLLVRARPTKRSLNNGERDVKLSKATRARTRRFK